jgi:putative transposase
VRPERESIRFSANLYRGRGSYFVTLCCEARQRIFSDQRRAHQLVEKLASQASKHNFAVHAYCVMPDHAHLLAEGLQDACDLLGFVKELKQLSAYHYKQETGQRLWQKKYYDHILRSAESLDAVAWYIWLNPVRAAMH